jgi:hypothetical protein
MHFVFVHFDSATNIYYEGESVNRPQMEVKQL